jgi:hypothetical protein
MQVEVASAKVLGFVAFMMISGGFVMVGSVPIQSAKRIDRESHPPASGEPFSESLVGTEPSRGTRSMAKHFGCDSPRGRLP